MARRLNSEAEALAWLAGRVPPQGSERLRTDSRLVQPGDAYIAWPGAATDGRRFVPAALAAGAAACLVEAEGVEPFGFDPRRRAHCRAARPEGGHRAPGR